MWCKGCHEPHLHHAHVGSNGWIHQICLKPWHFVWFGKNYELNVLCRSIHIYYDPKKHDEKWFKGLKVLVDYNNDNHLGGLIFEGGFSLYILSNTWNERVFVVWNDVIQY